ncbi:MAG: hypothetical protein ABI910_12175 [Gemmatimonadota bacterium]
MRTALFALIGAALVATTPVVARAQSPVDIRPGGVSRDRDASGRTRDRDGRWDWERGRDDRNDRNDRNDRDRRDARNDRRGYGHDDWKVYEREQRDFDRRTHRWSSRQWNAYRTCERDLWRRSRWDRNDSRREALSERRRIRDYCERRVSRW